MNDHTDNLPPLPEPTYKWNENDDLDAYSRVCVLQIQREAFEAGKRAAPAPVARDTVDAETAAHLVRVARKASDWAGTEMEPYRRAREKTYREEIKSAKLAPAPDTQAAAQMERRDAIKMVDALCKDAARYRWLRKTLHEAVGGGIEVNDRRLVYEESEPGEAVLVYWYPATPVGRYELKADTLDSAIDAMRVLIGAAPLEQGK